MLEKPFTGAEFIQNDAQGEDVRAHVDGIASALFGAHIAELSFQHSGLGVLRFGGRFCDSEVDDLDLAFISDEKVLRRNITMNDLIGRAISAFKMMGVMQSFAGIGNGARREGWRKSLLSFDAAPGDGREIFAGDVLHRNEESALGFAEVIDLDDIRMDQLGAHSRFVLKHSNEGLFFREMAQDFFDDNKSGESGKPALARKPDLRHPARGEFSKKRKASELFYRPNRRHFGLLGRWSSHGSYWASLLGIDSARKLMTWEFASLILGFLMVLGVSSSVQAAGPTSAKALKALKRRLRIKPEAIVNICAAGAAKCDETPLSRTFDKLKAVSEGGPSVRILHLGDSHIAADYISGPIRRRLQAEFGDAGRGFMHIDHWRKYGGRLRNRDETAWKKRRHVELHKQELPFGFSGISLESKRANARLVFHLAPADSLIRLYYQQQPHGGSLQLRVAKQVLGPLATEGRDQSMVAQFQLPQRSKKANRLALRAQGPKTKLYGISFETGKKGVFFDPIGPVGADAKLYLQFGEKSFRAHLKAYRADLYVIMVGGNDAMKIRKGWTTLKRVENDHLNLVKRLRSISPNADCMLWSPMDAGRRKRKKIHSQTMIGEVATMQAAVAKRLGCAFWDLYGLMGNKGAIVRWNRAKVMNRDLVHPKRAAADLIGEMFSDAFLSAYHEH